MGGMDGMSDARVQSAGHQQRAVRLGARIAHHLNGAYQPIITIAPGEKQFFRVVNATGHKTLKL